MIPKNDLLNIFQKEFATTLKVMKAYPKDKIDFSPHERSQKAKRLMSTFIFEMYLLRSYLFGEKVDRSVFQQYNKETLDELIADFQSETSKVIDLIQKSGNEILNKQVQFAGVNFEGGNFAMMMLFDQIHHRGQLSVYIRMIGGKVPSIYGPSADDSSTNL
ncbi:MAG: hypothetical protein JST17_01340 [Bacteroidetes bacterium]|nr:hypothetical protein [Bacteroidota bacterium]MBS1931927.1 hypothetical protein [Bacteroidota bacterium]